MYRFKRWMIGLDFTLMDKMLISYAAFFSEIIKPDKIYFINVEPNLDVPENIRKNFPELNKPIDEKLKGDMKEEVERNFKNHKNFDIEYEVIEGNPFEEMLHWSDVKNIDLLLMGRKKELKGSGVVADKLARKVRCSVLFVPENPKLELKELFVPIDFSDNSKMALEKAVSLAEKDPEATIFCEHVYHLPSGYYTTGKTEEEFSKIMKEHATKKYNELLESIDFNHSHITPIFELDKQGSAADHINSMAHKKDVDMIVVGARGRTGATAILLGSVTEKLIKLDTDIPILVVKDKEKTFNFVDFLKTV